MAWEVVTDEVAVPRDVAALGDGRLLVADQVGEVRVVEKDGSTRTEAFLDLAGKVLQPTSTRRESGLNGLALAPDFATSGIFYTWMSAPKRATDPEDVMRVDTLTRWRADTAAMTTHPKSAEVLLEVPQSHPDHVGDMVMGKDGLLYIGVGAGGGDAAAQDPTKLPGSILRLKVGPTGPYTIPEGNPFDGNNGRREIWSYGYRNPFRLHHDAELGLIVSEPMFREKDQQVSVATVGANAGYPKLPTQARSCWVDGKAAPECGQGIPGFVAPVLEYSPAVGVIVSGAVRTSGGAGGPPRGRSSCRTGKAGSSGPPRGSRRGRQTRSNCRSPRSTRPRRCGRCARTPTATSMRS